MKKAASFLKDIFLFKPETKKEPFILDNNDDENNEQSEDDMQAKADGDAQNDEQQENTKDIEEEQPTIKKHVRDRAKQRKGEKTQGKENEESSVEEQSDKEQSDKEQSGKEQSGKEQPAKDQPAKAQPAKRTIKQPIALSSIPSSEKKEKAQDQSDSISSSISINFDVIKKRYSANINGDFKTREFKIRIKEEMYTAFVCFFDGMVDRLIVNSTILQPLMTLSTLPIDAKEQSAQDIVYNNLIPHNQIKVCKTYQDIVDEVNFGGIGIFIDKINIAFAGDVKGWEHRNVEKPTSELNIRGPKESFNETNRVNTALIRKTLKDENLIVEDVLVGTRSKTPCSILYIKNIANDSLVEEVRKRVKSIKIGYLKDSGELEQLLEDSTYLPAPQMLLTERPDRVTTYLGEGRVAIVVHGSPFVIVAPVNLFNLIHSPEDSYIRHPYATLLRFVRIISILFALLLPSIYLAITNYHQEMLPTDLLLAIASSREKVPFPTFVSLLIMEIAFELIREAGIRIPGPIGPTLGIVGALILGQAAVAANLVSPILIIIVAVTGIGSFAIPDFSVGYSIRTLRFAYLLLASIAGLLGIALGIFVNVLFLVHAKSFGVPFLVPFAPKTGGKRANTILKTPLWKEEDRPDFVNPKDVKQQPFISRGWVKSEKGINKDAGKN